MARTFQLAIDVKKLVRAFEDAPEQTHKMVVRNVKKAVRDIREHARDHHPSWVSRTGHAENKLINSEVDGVSGVVYVEGYATYLHRGTPAYDIVPRKKKALRWVASSFDHFIFAKRVHHPGIKGDPFLFRAGEEELPAIQSRFEADLDRILARIGK